MGTVHVFKSAVTRGGNVLTPDIIEIHDDVVVYKKRNKILIGFDTITVPISKITSVSLNTSLWGTDIIIRSQGEDVIVGRKFTKSDAREIKKLIEERMRK